MSRPPVLLLSALRVVIAAAFFALPGFANAQEVRGVVRLEETGEPVDTALIELVRDPDAIVARTLSGADGTFRVVAPAAGSYRLRVQRIGLAAVTTDPFPLGDSPVIRDIMVGTQPISLAGIEVAGTRRCDLQGNAPVSVQRLWEEARKTLHSVALLDGGRRVSFQVEEWTRDVDPLTKRVRTQGTRQRTVTQSQPFLPRSASDLVRDGFMQRDGDSTTYYLPDAGVLLSDEFLEAYCFHAVAADGRVGLAFRPVTRTRGAGIRGTLWLDAATAALQEIELAYTNAPWGRARSDDGTFIKEVDVKPHGALYFDRTENGAWIVSHWFVRMPRFAIRRGRETGHVIYARESGGRVLSSSLLPRGRAAHGGTLRGVLRVNDDAPLAGAVVYLAGTDRVATTAEDGSFAMSDVLPGQYALAWMHDDDRAGERVAIANVVVASADTSVALRALPYLDHLAQVCPRGARPNGAGVVLGRALLEDGLPVAGASVVLSDPDGRVDRATTDAAGRFAFCAVHREARIEVESGDARSVRHVALAPDEVLRIAMRLPRAPGMVTTDTLISDSMLARLRADSAATADSIQAVTLRRAVERVVARNDVGTGRVVGQVMNEAGTEPVAGAFVEVPGTDVQVVTDARGRFRFEAPSPWFALRVTHVGFEPVGDTITVPAGDVLHLDVRMGVLTLAPITVSARRTGLLADAYWRMARGTGGTFLDADYIARRNPRVLTDALRDQAGVQVETAGSGVSNRGGSLYFRALCAPEVYLDGMRITHVENRHSGKAGVESFDAVNLVHPASIELVEIYRGASTLPAEFGGSVGSCGAIVIWTKRGTTPQAN